MSEGINYYATLGIARTATASEIKDAYRHRAKAAHPDAGGSVEAMARVNEAYKALSDPTARSDYDLRQATPARPDVPYPTDSHRPAETVTQQRPSASQSTSTYGADDASHEAQYVNRQRTAWARESAWELARLSAPVAVVVIIVTRLIAPSLADNTVRMAAGFFAFVPVYALALSIVFLISPSLRLIYGDLVRRHPTTPHERLAALALLLAFIPLGYVWVLLFYLG
jgi:DnaJ domain